MSNSEWAEHGLAGLVIGSLFVLITLILRANHKKDSKRDDKYTETILKITSDAAVERNDSADRNERSSNRLADALDALTKTIQKTSVPDE